MPDDKRQDDAATADDTAFHERFTKALAGEDFAKVLNKAFAGHSKRMLTSAEFKASLAEVFTSTMAAAKAAEVPGDDDGDADATPDEAPAKRAPRAGGKMDPEVKRAIDAANRKADAAHKVAEDEKKRREESEGKAAANEERALLTETLSAAGIQKDMLSVALAYLKEEKRVARAQDGKVVWKDGDQELDVSEGIAAWTKSPLGQRFLPPREASGSGSPPANGQHGKRGAGGKVEYSDADLGNMLKSL